MALSVAMTTGIGFQGKRNKFKGIHSEFSVQVVTETQAKIID